MTAIIIPERRLVQPRGRIQVDYDVLRRLNVIALVEPTARRNLADFLPDLTGTGQGLLGTATTRLGAAFDIATSGPSASIPNQVYTQFSMAWYGVSGTLTSNYNFQVYGYTADASGQWQGFLHSNIGAGNYIWRIYYSPSFTGSIEINFTPSSGPGQIAHLIGTFRNTVATRIYSFGRQVASGTPGTANGAKIDGTFFTGSPLRSHALSYSVMANREWTADEAREIGQNPWIFFRPANSPIFYSLPSDSATYAVDFSDLLITNDSTEASLNIVQTLGETAVTMDAFSGQLAGMPVLSNPAVIDVTATSARPRVTLTY